MLKDVDLEAMDDTIEYMDNSIREIPRITLRTPAETDLSLKHMTTSVSGSCADRHSIQRSGRIIF